MILLMPILMGNKACKRSITWGDPNKDLVAIWESDHKDFDKSTKCVDCHDDRRSSTKPPKSHNSHDIVWKREHGKYAQIKYGFRNENVCRLCHKDSFCESCHQIEQPQNHTVFWKNKAHGLAVGLDRSKCTTCHISDDFCIRCHSETKPLDHTGLWGSTRDLHCLSCHFPLTASIPDRCGVCHQETPSHLSAPAAPNTIPFHVAGADCRSCHAANLSHADNGGSCLNCHAMP